MILSEDVTENRASMGSLSISGAECHLEIAMDQPNLVDVLNGMQDIDHCRCGILRRLGL